MIFKRRRPPTAFHRVREFVYPRKGFWRGFGYIGKRMRRLPDTPHRIALGFACGTFASFSPFFTLHFIVSALFAWVLRANIVAALFGTIVGNPLTFPAIASSALWVGRTVLGRDDTDGSSFDAVMAAFGAAFESAWGGVKSWFGYEYTNDASILEFLDEVFLPYLVGGALIGIVAAFISYWVLGPLVAAYQNRRQRRIENRAAERRQEIDDEQEAYGSHDSSGDNA